MKWGILFVLACAMAGDVALGQPKEPARSETTVAAWVDVLARNIADRHDTIRDSARAALVTVGKPALPTLKRIAAGKDDAAADAAKKLIARIQDDSSPRKTRAKSTIFKPPVTRDLPPKEDDAPKKKPEKGRVEKGERKGLGLLKGFSLPGPFGKGFSLARLDPVNSALKDLNLSEEQQSKVEGIRKGYDQKTREQLKKHAEAQKTLREDMLKDVKGVLTPEQRKEFEKAVKKRPGRAVAPGKNRKGGLNLDLSGRFLPRLEIRLHKEAGGKR